MPRAWAALVIGGGINGLATAYHLGRLGVKPVALLEQYTIGHDRGSSHGMSRISRSTYADADYVRWMRPVPEEWARLERDGGQVLRYPNPCCFFGRAGEKFASYARAVVEGGADVERLDPTEGRRRFPAFRFEDVAGVLDDHTAALLAAHDTLKTLAHLSCGLGVTILENTPVAGVDIHQNPIVVETAMETWATDRLVITAGPWTQRLLPWFQPVLSPIRQTVGYFQLSGPSSEFQMGRFPVWVYLEDGDNNVYYGLPEFGRPGVKFARHYTTGRADDPDGNSKSALPASTIFNPTVADLYAFANQHFSYPVERLLDAEFCMYTNTPTEDFIMDLHPHNPAVAIGAGFSGHGFKFGPLTGRVLAEWVVHGQVSVPEFAPLRQRFAIPRALVPPR